MTLRDDLTRLVGLSYATTWETFDWVRSHPKVFGLSPTKTARWKTPGEPAFVSNLLEYPVNQYRLWHVIQRHLQPLGLSKGRPLVSAVFIHQKPKVQFKGFRGHVELGDLLLVRQHFQSKVSAPQGRAFLVQAKSCARPSTGSLKDKEAQQFALYSDWSRSFVFPHKEIGAPPDGSGRWNFTLGPAPHSNSGVYGLVANSPSVLASFPAQCPWAVGYAQAPTTGSLPSVSAGLSLAEVLEGFLLGSWGRRWEASPSATDHWSSFIVECLRVATSWSPYPVQRTGSNGKNALTRRRDVLALVHALSRLPTSAPTAWELPWTFASDDELGVRRQRTQRLTAEWENSLGDGGGDSEDPPDALDVARVSPSGGVSVLYVATFGDNPLTGDDTGPGPAASAGNDSPQHTDGGSW